MRGGELFTHLCKRKKFDLATARMILAEIVIALENVHKAGVIYRDLKLENILLDEEVEFLAILIKPSSFLGSREADRLWPFQSL